MWYVNIPITKVPLAFTLSLTFVCIVVLHFDIISVYLVVCVYNYKKHN